MTTIAGRIVTPDSVVRGTVQIEADRIAAITANRAGPVEHDFGDALIVPGFIDIHIHGIGPFGLFTANDIAGASALQPQYGTTAFLPSVASATEEDYLQFGRNVRLAQTRTEGKGARILGAHLEGPFINPDRKGGMDADYLRPMNLDECRHYLNELPGIIKLMTLSPELDGSEPIIRLLHEAGVVVSLGHSDPTIAELDRAVAAGLNHICHLFNTFRPRINAADGVWRDSLIFAILANDKINCELICDLHHVSPEMIKTVARALAPDRFIAITDSMTGTGQPPGEYTMTDGRKYTTETGVGALVSNGTIVGSVLTMNKAFKNLTEATGLDPTLIARFTAANPARALGIDAELGSIQPGKRADLAVLDRDYNCIATFINGQLIHHTQ